MSDATRFTVDTDSDLDVLPRISLEELRAPQKAVDPTKLDRCPARASKVNPHRREELAIEAYNFNALLHAHHKPGTDPFLEFYHHLARLPVGERRELVRHTLEMNASMRQSDPTLSRIQIEMSKDGFINKFQIGSMMYGGWSMCAEYKTPPPRQFEVIK